MGADPDREVDDACADAWETSRGPEGGAADFAVELGPTHRPVVDLGCGSGGDLPALGRPAIGLDVAGPSTQRIGRYAPGAWAVRADLRDLPFRGGAIGAAWASRSYVHVARPELPMALWDLHRVLRVGAPVRLRLLAGGADDDPRPGGESAEQGVARWDPGHLAAVAEGAGFAATVTTTAGRRGEEIVVDGHRARTLADTVGEGMRLLVVGLNPSWYAADRGIPFARPGNRFWPAALAAGLVSRDRDPAHALGVHGVGMTDLVKRPTTRAAEVRPAEFRAGLSRVDRLVAWLRPGAVAVVGITGWRLATGDRRARLGHQEVLVGGRPVHVVPNPSGLNAHTDVDDLAARLADAAGG